MRAINKTNKVRKVSNRDRKINSLMEFLRNWRDEGDVAFKYVSNHHWLGSYGHVADMYYDDITIAEANVKKLSNLIANSNVHVMRGFGATKVYCIPKDAEIINLCGKNMIKLTNGQLYDTYSSFWFTVADSKAIFKAVNNGYIYRGPYAWFEYKEYEKNRRYYQSLISKGYDVFYQGSKINDDDEWKVVDKPTIEKIVDMVLNHIIIKISKGDDFKIVFDDSLTPCYYEEYLKEE